MKKKNFAFLFLLFYCLPGWAQKASDVLENGVKIKSDQQVFLKLEGGNILYQLSANPTDLQFKKLADSIMLLPVASSVVLYIRPLNPLNYSFSSETTFIADPIDAAATAALGSIIDFVANINAENKAKLATAQPGRESAPGTTCDFQPWIVAITGITEKLQRDQKPALVSIFKNLKQLDFNVEQQTITALNKEAANHQLLVTHFSAIETAIKAFKDSIKLISCDDKSYEFLVKGYFQIAIKDLEANSLNQKKRLTNLSELLRLVQKAQAQASALNWFVKVSDIAVNKGKIALVAVTITETGYQLSDQEEIVAVTPKEKANKLLRFRRFQCLVPEVSVGIAYANLSFPKFGTNKNASGQDVVADAGEEAINKVNITTMINYTLFIPNTSVHPFWQLGIGLNTDFPTILTGVGVRINASGVRRLALAAGVATTWIKSLNKLTLGEVVAGPAAVEKDTYFKFNTRPQPYVGLQFNF